MEIKIAVVGMAHFHIHMIIEEVMQVKGVKIVALVDENILFTEKTSREFRIPTYQSMDEMLENIDVDIIISAAINNQKVNIILKSIELGKPIIIDKPMATTLKDLEKIERALKTHEHAKLYMMLVERFNPTLYTAKKLIDDGEIGEIVNMISLKPHKINYTSRPDWFFDRKAYGGLINDLGVHDIDIFRWFTNSDVDSIIAAISSNKKYSNIMNFDDNSELLVKMTDRSTCFLRVDWLTPDAFPFHGDYRVMIIGTKGTIEALYADPKAPKLILNNETKASYEVPLLTRGESMSDDFITCAMSRTKQPVFKTRDALIATRVALNAQIISDNREGRNF